MPLWNRKELRLLLGGIWGRFGCPEVPQGRAVSTSTASHSPDVPPPAPQRHICSYTADPVPRLLVPSESTPPSTQGGCVLARPTFALLIKPRVHLSVPGGVWTATSLKYRDNPCKPGQAPTGKGGEPASKERQSWRGTAHGLFLY